MPAARWQPAAAADWLPSGGGQQRFVGGHRALVRHNLAVRRPHQLDGLQQARLPPLYPECTQNQDSCEPSSIRRLPFIGQHAVSICMQMWLCRSARSADNTMGIPAPRGCRCRRRGGRRRGRTSGSAARRWCGHASPCTSCHSRCAPAPAGRTHLTSEPDPWRYQAHSKHRLLSTDTQKACRVQHSVMQMIDCRASRLLGC